MVEPALNGCFKTTGALGELPDEIVGWPLLASTTGRRVFAWTCKTPVSRRRVKVRRVGFIDCVCMG
jgi:hypothetical protein